ncbi:MAG: cyclic nucleotide-binding domain-containing protein [Brevinematia bacterium]
MENDRFTLVKFPKDAYVLMEGEENRGEFFIIKEGRVNITNPHSVEKSNIILKTGDFFGVIPCMAKRTNMETARTLSNVIAIMVKREQFGTLIQKNASIALKIIRYFSKELRHYDELLGKVLASSPSFREEVDENILYNLGEYYYKKSNFEAAVYAFRKFVSLSSNSSLKDEATTKLEKLSKVNIKEPEKEGKFLVYNDKQIVFLEGESGENLYLIQDGRVKITKFINNEEVLFDILKKGDIFGEMAIIENKPRNASAFCEGRVVLMPIRKEDFENVVKTFPSVATRIIELISERIWIMYRQLTNMFISSPEIKIYDALYTQLLKHRIPVEEKRAYTFAFSAEDLLKYVGLATEEGLNIWREIKSNDKNFSITPNGKIQYLDVSQIRNKINFILREKEIRENKKKFYDSSLQK